MKRIAVNTGKLTAGVIISGVLFYIAFRDVAFVHIVGSIKELEATYLGAATACVFLLQLLRTMRWGVLLGPVVSISSRRLFAVNAIGFMFVVLLPLRVGEFVRPYLLSHNSSLSFSSALATIVVERILDCIFILALFVLVLNLIDAPVWISNFAIGLALMLLVVTGLLVAGQSTTGNRLGRELGRKVLPLGLASSIARIAGKFYSGMSIISDIRQLTVSVVLSAVIWSVAVAVNWLLLKALGIDLGVTAAIVILVFTMLGISVPAGPGFVGSFHLACLLGLSFFEINKDLAAAYALALHAVTVGTVITLGIISFIVSKVGVSRFSLKYKEPIDHPGATSF